MTGEELAKLPVGTLVKHDGGEGEILQAGRVVHIMFPCVPCTVLIDTESKSWQKVIADIEVME